MLDGHGIKGDETTTGYTCRLLDWPTGACGTRYWGTHVFLVPVEFASKDCRIQGSCLNVVLYNRPIGSTNPFPYLTTCAGGAPNITRGNAFHRAFLKAVEKGEKVFDYEDEYGQRWSVAFVPARTAADAV